MDFEEDNCTLTFVNSTSISVKEVEKLFSKFSNNLKCTEREGRVFVKLGTEKEAEKAIECLGSFIKLKRACDLPKNLSQKECDLPCDHPSTKSIPSTSKSCLDQWSYVKRESSSNSNTDASSYISTVDSFPQLLDMKNIKKIYPIIVANLPGPFTLEDVLNLVEESEPAGVSELCTTNWEKLKYCEIYLKSLEDVQYLKNKLDRFVIGGKKLLVVEPSECLAGHKWSL